MNQFLKMEREVESNKIYLEDNIVRVNALVS